MTKETYQPASLEADQAIMALVDSYHAEGSKSWEGVGARKYRVHDREITVKEQEEISDEELREILSLEVALMLPE